MRAGTNINFTGNKINVLFYNDLHGQIKNMDIFNRRQEEYYKSHAAQTNLTLSGGDVFLDRSKHNDLIAKELVKRTDAIAVGNHDIEGGIDYLLNLLKRHRVKQKFLSMNFLDTQSKTGKKPFSGSKILKRNGEEFGVIGVSPFDFRKLAHITTETKNIEVENLEKTEKNVRKEVKKLEAAGINKIFLLAHTGHAGNEDDKIEEYYNRLAKIGGIDVIIGGHDHREFDYETKTERNEPVKVVSTGKSEQRTFGENLDCYGILELEFDDNGIITGDKTTFVDITSNQKGGDEIVHTFNEPVSPKNFLTGHNETGNIIADACFEYAKNHGKTPPDFAFVNSGTIRSEFNGKNVTAEDIINIVPFTTSLLIQAPLTKKQIQDTLNWCAKSTSFEKVSPGLMQVSGIEYSVDKNLNAVDIKILNEDGSVKYRLDDFDDDAEFNVVYDCFLATGVAGLGELKKDIENDKSIEQFYVPRQTALLEYLTSGKEIKDFKKQRIRVL